MAGKQFSFSFGDSNASPVEAIDFAFNFGGNYPQLSGDTTDYSGAFSVPILGHLEFLHVKSPPYWKSILSFCAICAIFLFGFHFMLSTYKMENIAYISTDSVLKSATPFQALAKQDLAPEAIVNQPAVKAIEASPKIAQVKSPERKIKQAEKTENQAQPTLLSFKPEKTVQKIASPPITPRIKEFTTNSFDKAKSLAANTGRYIFIKFGAEWCVPCQLMESTALKNQSVLDLLNSKFVMLTVDIDDLAGYIIKEAFHVERLPTLIILDASGTQVNRHEGGLGTSALIGLLSEEAQYVYLKEEGITADVSMAIASPGK